MTIAFCRTLAAVVTLGLLWSAHGQLMCYNCFLSPSRNDCMDANALLLEHQRYLEHKNTTNGTATFPSELVVACPTNHSRCVVEYIVDGDQAFKLMYRDCSDGQTFSADLSGTRLSSVGSNADNITHCAYHSGIQATVCISLCSGNLCNGPQTSRAAPTLIGRGQSHVMLTSAMVAMFVVCVGGRIDV